jgi:ATP-dependent DNA ligase
MLFASLERTSPATGLLNTWQASIRASTLYVEYRTGSGETKYDKTTFDSQDEAISNLKHKVATRIRRGFFHVGQQPAISPPIPPMLANRWQELSPRRRAAEYPVFVQPKFNGERVVWHRKSKTLWTRGRQLVTMLPHLTEFLTKYKYPSLDGELLADGLSLQEIHSIVSRRVNNHPRAREIYIMGYDLPNLEQQQCDRLNTLMKFPQKKRIRISPLWSANSDAEVDALHAEAVAQGYEGVVVRTWFGKYRPGCRSPDLLKYKIEKDDYFLITGFSLTNKQFPLLSLASNGGTFRAVVQADHPEQRRIVAEESNRLIGTWAKVAYMDTTLSGLPQHARIVLLTYSKEKP